mgnify:CR=1 FL=1
MRFTQDEINAAVAQFKQDAQSRTVAAAGFNGEITVYGAEDVAIQKTSGASAGDAEPGAE